MKEPIAVDSIKQVYIGKAGYCCCGCSGKYHKSATMIKKVVNKLNKELSNVEIDPSDKPSYYSLTVKNSWWVAYIK